MFPDVDRDTPDIFQGDENLRLPVGRIRPLQRTEQFLTAPSIKVRETVKRIYLGGIVSAVAVIIVPLVIVV